jgi:hypothetical protein
MNTVVDHLLELIRIPSDSSASNRPIAEYAQEVFRNAQWNTASIRFLDAAGIEKINLIAAPPGQAPQEVEADLAFSVTPTPFHPPVTGPEPLSRSSVRACSTVAEPAMSKDSSLASSLRQARCRGPH